MKYQTTQQIEDQKSMRIFSSALTLMGFFFGAYALWAHDVEFVALCGTLFTLGVFMPCEDGETLWGRINIVFHRYYY